MADIRQLCDELATKAREELHEVDSRTPEDIAALRGWVEKQPHLKARTDDQFLITFLRGSKFSIEKAKQKFDYFYTIRSLSPEIFLNKLLDDKAMRLHRLGPFVALPKTLKPDGPRLHITRYSTINPSEYHIIDVMKAQFRILDVEMHEDDNATIAGVINIIDLGATPIGFLLQFDPMLVKKFAVFLDKSMPLRIKGIHLINMPKEAVTIVNIARSLCAKKLKERMFVHTSLESLYEHIPKEYLPEEYGGHNGRFQDSIDHWEKRLLGYKKYFEEDLQYGANEKLRVGAQISPESLFGLDGSFRKLEVD